MLEYISALGVGALLSTIAQYALTVYKENKLRAFNEKKEAYIGLLEAYHKAAVSSSIATAKEFAYWQMRCELVASQSVIKAIQEIIDSNEDRERRNVAHEDMKKQMRSDLGVAKR